MPLLTPVMYDRIATAMEQAEASVVNRFRTIAENNGDPQPLSPEQQADLKHQMKVAWVEQLLLLMAQNMVITILPGAVGLQSTVSLGSPTGPPVAPVPLQPGVGFTIT